MFRLAIVFLLTLTLPALAAQRVAMVVGNNAYPHLPSSEQLYTARNDARAVAEALRRNGFKVFHGEDLSRGDFIQMLFDFTGSLGEGDLALFFYAGHGINLEGGNYLLPSDIRPPQSTRRLEGQRMASLSIHEQEILAAMRDSGATVSVAILDACRNNPIENPDGRSVGATRGLARAATMPQGTFSIYAAGYGQVALDRLPGEGDAVHSVFTRVLLEKLEEPGVTLRGLALSTRGEVRKLAAKAGHEQSPAYYDELGGDDPVLLTAKAEGVVNPVVTDAAPGGDVDAQIELMMIDEIRSSRDPAMLQAYLDTYPNGRFSAFARARLNGLDAEPDRGQVISTEVAELRSQIQELQTRLDDALAQKEDSETEKLVAEAKLGESQRQSELLNQQVGALRQQLGRLQELLDEYQALDAANRVQLETLGSELNAALARVAAEERRRRQAEDKLATTLENFESSQRAWNSARNNLESRLSSMNAELAAAEAKAIQNKAEQSAGSEENPFDALFSDDLVTHAGMTAQRLSSSLRQKHKVKEGRNGLVITFVKPGSPADTNGLIVGEVITEIGQKPVLTPTFFEEQVKAARNAGRKSILLMVWREGSPRFVALPSSP